MDHGGHNPRGIALDLDYLVPKVFCFDPLDRLADIRADYLITFVHLLALLSLDDYIIKDPD